MPPSFTDLPDEQLYEEYGAPELEPIVRQDGKPLVPGVPSHVVIPVWLGKPSQDFHNN